MTIRDILDAGIEIQGNLTVCYYSDFKQSRVKLVPDMVLDREINFMYCENDVLYIEVEDHEISADLSD